jgi:uncharacterized protein (TIGR02597 family)
VLTPPIFRRVCLAVFTAFLAVARPLPGQMVTTDPVGFAKISCVSNSDTFVSLPFTRPSEFVGAIQSVSGNTIVVDSTPWTGGSAAACDPVLDTQHGFPRQRR